MRSLVTSKNVCWPRLIWPTLYMTRDAYEYAAASAPAAASF